MTLSLRGATYRYPGGASVGPVDLVVRAGEMVLLTGPTGCGKSTLLRLAAGLVGRHGRGEVGGDVRIDGDDPGKLGPARRVERVGFVAQDPLDQVVAGTLGDEIAFGPESAGWPAARVEAAVDRGLAAIGFAGQGSRPTEALSGGQRQKLVIAASLAAGARVLVLDEPLSQLDPVAAQELVARLASLRDEGVAILIVEHRLDPILPVCDRVLILDGGRIVDEGPAADPPLATLRRLGLSVPPMLDLRDRLRSRGIGDRVRARPAPAIAAPVLGDVVLDAPSLSWRWGERSALDAVRLQVRAGERIAVLGANGSGKSTLLAALSGRIDAGPVTAGRVVDVPQDPDLALFSATVREELAVGPSELRLGAAEVERAVRAAAEALSIADLLERPPQALSRGQRLRTAVAAALTCAPRVLILDEPTSGQDGDQVERMMSSLHGADAALIFATHDVDLALRHATRVVVLHEGRIAAEGSPSEVDLVVPPLHRLARAVGLPPGTAAEIAEQLEEGEVPLDVASVGPVRPPAIEAGMAQEEARARSWLDPRTRLALLGAVGVLALTFDRPMSLAILALISAAPVPWSGVSRATLGRAFVGLVVVTWGTVLSQALFYGMFPRTPLFALGPLVVWQEGFLYGLVQSLRFVALTCAGLGLVASTPVDRLMSALVALRVPYGLAFLALTALRFVPETAREFLIVRDARSRRGRPVWSRSPWAWLALELSLLRPVVARALRRARVLAEALDTRGFDPTGRRAERRPLRLGALDGMALGGAASVAFAAVSARLVYALYTADVWYVPAWRPLYAFVRGWL